MKKTLIVLLLSFAMLFSLCACSGSTVDTDDETQTDTSAASSDASETDASETAAETEITWPTGDVTVYIPADVGSVLDLACRVMVDFLSEKTGVNFVAENDGSGEGARLGNLLLTEEPDGQTLMFCGCGQIISYYNDVWEGNLADTDDFTVIGPLIGQKSGSGAVLLTQPDKPYDTWEELVEYIKANPDTLTAAISSGRPNEIRMKLLFEEFGIMDMVRWVSASNNDTITGLLGGTIDLAMVDEVNGPAYMASGDLKGILDSRVDRDYPDDDSKPYLDSVQILSDISDNPEDLAVWWPMTIIGPAGMSDELCEYINDLCATIADSEEFMERVNGLGGTNTYEACSVEEFREIVAECDRQIATIIQEETEE